MHKAVQKERVSFEVDYLYKSKVQAKQNRKFLSFIFKNLKAFDYQPEVIAELGVGDGSLLKEITRAYKSEVCYLIDLNPVFLELAKRQVSGSSVIRILNVDFVRIGKESFGSNLPDFFVSSNSLHWLPSRETHDEWFPCIKSIFSSLKDGGFFFVHQGLRWTYFPLYDLAQELFYRNYGKKIDVSDYLYYPTKTEFVDRVKSAGFKLVDSKTFYEFDVNSDYTEEELYVSFSVAGLNVFRFQIDSEEERKKFTEEFLKLCRINEVPVFSHRGFFCLRKPYQNLSFKVVPPLSSDCTEAEHVRLIISEISEDFVPPLSQRSPDDVTFKSQTSSSLTADEYVHTLLRSYWNLIACVEDEKSGRTRIPAGILSFTVRQSFTDPRKSCVYVSTVGVRKKYRCAGIAGKLYDHFLKSVLPEVITSDERFSKVEFIETRTWSTNTASRRLLESKEFTRGMVLKDHRGSGVDTEYYVRWIR